MRLLPFLFLLCLGICLRLPAQNDTLWVQQHYTKREVLIPVPSQLSAMRGVLSVLGMDQASQAVVHMRDSVDELASTEVDPQRALQTGTFDRLADVYNSGTAHEEDQPVHLHVADTNICVERCTAEYGNPCQRFCPAAVYEMVEDPEHAGKKKLFIHHENCVHCKTCDIADPYQVITWTPPEGGEGPDYTQM